MGLGGLVVLLFVLAESRFTHSMLLLLCMYRRDIGCWLVAGCVGSSGLLAMPDEVLEILYGRHGLASVVLGILISRSEWTWRDREVVEEVFGKVAVDFEDIANGGNGKLRMEKLQRKETVAE